ncbi:hypothetical protein C8J56DRAFT_803020, partial [Mycena floridula]
ALIRDGFRCSLSHRYDLSTYTKNMEIQKLADDDSTMVPCTTNCCTLSVIPQILTLRTIRKRRSKYAASAWAVLKSFGYADIFKEINGSEAKGSGIHQLKNTLTLANSYHEMVDTLALWFDPVDDNENTHNYKVGANTDIVYREVPTIVTFTNSTPSGQAPLPMPSKRYLRLHAACAKVANMSAAAGYLDNFDREQEEHEASVLAEDGSSASFLEQCLHLVSLGQYTGQ